jgi:hypothetical protein
MNPSTESQTPLAVFPDRATAESAHQALQNAGFSVDHLSLVAQDKAPSPPVEKIEAKRSAGGGAIAGAMFGAIAGLLLSVASTATLGTAAFGPLSNLVGMVLAGSAIGAAGGGTIAALMGASVYKSEFRQDYIEPGQYLIFAEGNTEEVARAKHVLEQQGYLSDTI